MIAIGIAVLFISWVLDAMFNANTFPHKVGMVYGLVTLLGVVLIVAGVVAFAWRYLP